MRLAVGALALTTIALTVGPAAEPAAAHAVLLGSNPVDQAHLAIPPPAVELEFNEPVSVSTGGVRVYGADERRVDDGEPEADDTVVSVDLEDDLGDGAFVVAWRVISADGHAVRGAFTFTAGRVTAADQSVLADLLSTTGDRPWEVAAAVSRFLAYAGVLIAAGGALFLVAVYDRVLDRGGDRSRLSRLIATAAVVGAFGLLAGLPLQAALATGLGPSALLAAGVFGDVVAEGVGLAVATGLLGLGLVVVGTARSTAAGRVAALAGALLAAGSFALTGHTRNTSPAWVATVTDAVHAIAGAAWFGGLVVLAACLWWRRATSPADRAALIVRFSTAAAVVLAAVAASGLTLGWFEVRAVRAITGTTFGWLLTAKVGVVAAVVGLAAWNRWGLLPAVQADIDGDDGARAAGRLRRTVTLEAAGLAVAVALTALLVNVTPARVEAGVGTSYATTVAIGDGSLDVLLDPNRVGRNVFHLYLADAAGAPDQAEEVSVELTLPSADIGPIRRTAVDVGSGHWLLDSSDLTIGGRWQVDVAARRDRFTEDRATFEVVVNR
ncbi:MAG: copper resistance CopC/CopD family protein [Acidimicrobiales bacterium]